MKLSPQALRCLHEAIKSNDEDLRWKIANQLIQQPDGPEIDEVIAWLNLLEVEVVHEG